MSYIVKNCLNCKAQFNAPTREVNRGNGKFCSSSCSATFNGKNRPKPKANVICAYCEKEFYKAPNKQKLSKSGLYFCSREHKDAAQRIGGIREIMPPHYGTSLSSYRTLAIRTYGAKCQRCDYDAHEAAIAVHHKDHNHSNNSIDNLEVLCWNCHAIEHWGD